MSFLKKKIQLKHAKTLSTKVNKDSDINVKIEPSIADTTDSESASSPNVQEFLLPMRKPRQKPACPEGNSKNIVKNYGKALCSFASSNIAVIYVEGIVSKKGYKSVKTCNFMSYIKGKKESINSIESLRKLLIAEENDAEEIKAYKDIFKEVSVTFLKYFAVNWIYGGKLMHKNAHLKYRFKMLRRVQNPEFFTYLKTSAK